ncbi:carboxypeptidase-like regulatory domain-containing protein [Hymenobacter bucti]|uniref:Carboxypeptidase-like regulatory domain-containing protein n=1 Tax=Hymenobacter bucti TaxID=1844114 RepID=A0ABW4R1S3_9BACT
MSAVVVSVTLSGCQKEDVCDGSCIEVYGRVGSAANSTVPLPGASIQLSWVESGNSFFPKPPIVLKEVASDAEGRYSIKFTPTAAMQNGGRYRLLYSKIGYGDESLGTSSTRAYETSLQLVAGSRNEKNLHLPLRGEQLRLLITGFPGASAANGTYLTVYSGQGGPGNVVTGSDLRFYDTATGKDAASRSDLTDVTCRPAANEYAQVQLYKKKAGVTILLQDSIYCPLNVPVTYTHAF